MGSIKFYSSGYWDVKTMKESHVKPTEENAKKVEDFCIELNAKYAFHKGCPKHPEEEQTIWVYFHNGLKSLNVSPTDTCRCSQMIMRLNEICLEEERLNNPPLPKN